MGRDARNQPKSRPRRAILNPARQTRPFLHPQCAMCMSDNLDNDCIGFILSGCIHKTTHPNWKSTGERTLIEIRDSQKRPLDFYVDEWGMIQPIYYAKTINY